MILVDISVPVTDDSFDFLLDEDTQIGKVIMEICEMLGKRMQNDHVEAIEEFSLYDMDQKIELNKVRTLNQLNIHEGARLMLL